jgi:hypothetical protein
MHHWVRQFQLVHRLVPRWAVVLSVEDGKLTMGADVKLALGVGITLQPSITVDTQTSGECSEGSCQTSRGGGDTHGNSSEQHSQEGGQCS